MGEMLIAIVMIAKVIIFIVSAIFTVRRLPKVYRWLMRVLKRWFAANKPPGGLPPGGNMKSKNPPTC